MDDTFKFEGVEEKRDMNNIEGDSIPQDFVASGSREEFLSGVSLEQPVVGSSAVKEKRVDLDFGQKFDTKITLDLPNGKVSYRDVEPQKLGEKASEVPLVLLPGWSMQSPILKYVGGELNSEGQEFVTVDIEGGGKSVKAEGSSEINRQAELLYQVINKLDKGKVDLAGQSQGVLTVLSLFRLHPEVAQKLRSVLLVSGVGLGDSGGRIDLLRRNLTEMGRFGKTKKGDETKDMDKMVQKMIAHNVLGSPIKAFSELNAIATQNEYATIEQIRGSGVKVGLMQGELDLLADTKSLWGKIGEGSERPFKTLTQEDYEKDKEEYDKRGIKPGQTVYDRDVANVSPSFDAITMTDGGHEVFGSKAYARKMIRAISELNNPNGFGPSDEEKDARAKIRLDQIRKEEDAEIQEVRKRLEDESVST